MTVCVHITYSITAGPVSGQDDGLMSIGVLPSFQASCLQFTLETANFLAKKDQGNFLEQATLFKDI